MDNMTETLPGKFYVERGMNMPIRGNNYTPGEMHEKDLTRFEGSFFDYFEFVREKPNMTGSHNADHNQRFNDYIKSDEEATWKGGTFQDFIAPHRDFLCYHETLKKIQQDKLFKELAHSFAETMQRKRVRSEYDGEYDVDKRWDSQPFQHRSKKPHATRVVKLTTEGAFSCSVDAKTINQFASFVAAVITMLERNTILVELNIRYTVTEISVKRKGPVKPNVGEVLFKVKRPDEYLPPSQVMKCLSANWYRRAVFSVFVALADQLGGECAGGLGYCIQWGRVWERKDNELFIYGIPSYDDQNKILESLTKFISKGDKK